MAVVNNDIARWNAARGYWQRIQPTDFLDPWYLRRDGSNSPTANIDWGGFDLTNVGNLTVNDDLTIDADDKALILGAGQDAKIYYDGTDLIIDPAVVGAGRVLIGAAGGNELVAGDITTTTNFNLPTTADANTGVIEQNSVRFIHSYGDADNFFAGRSTGNFTMSGALKNTGVGAVVLAALTSGDQNTAGGYGSLNSVKAGMRNTAYGAYSAVFLTGSETTAIGENALRNSTSVLRATALGYRAGYTNQTGDGGVYLGAHAGYYETAGNKCFLDNAARANEADGRVKALVHGLFAATTAAQWIRFNGAVVCGGDAALATNATAEFLYIPSCAGAPTGVPVAYTGKVAMVYDTTNDKLYCYNAAWVAIN